MRRMQLGRKSLLCLVLVAVAARPGLPAALRSVLAKGGLSSACARSPSFGSTTVSVDRISRAGGAHAFCG